jgi:exoribonuclease II
MYQVSHFEYGVYAHWLEQFTVFCIYQAGFQYFCAYVPNNFISGFLNTNKVPGRKYETESTSWEVTTFDGFCVLKKVFSVIQSSVEIEQLSKFQYFYVITVSYVVSVLSDTYNVLVLL